MMGWRVGYLAYPAPPEGDSLGPQLLKVQDTIPICTAQLPQLVALKALEEGREWVAGHVRGLECNRFVCVCVCACASVCVVVVMVGCVADGGGTLLLLGGGVLL